MNSTKGTKAVCFLIHGAEKIKSQNFILLSNALLDRGDSVFVCLIDTLEIRPGDIVGKVAKVDRQIREGESLDCKAFSTHPLRYFDYVWVLSFGKRETFLDKIQILWLLEQFRKVKVINSVQSLLFLHSKYSLIYIANEAGFHHPKTYVSSSFEFLWEMFQSEAQLGNRDIWIAKPPAESFGKNVFILRRNDTNAKVILQSMTSDEYTMRYCILQEYVPEISLKGEKRVLIANGRIIGYYLRKPFNDHRTNIHQGAEVHTCELSEDERELCKRIGQYLKNLGAYFVGIDMVYPYVIELNVLNPGGLGTILKITGKDLSQEVINSVIL